MNSLGDYREAHGEWDYSEIQRLRDYILRVEVPCEVRWAGCSEARIAGRRRPRADRHQRGGRGAHQDAHVRRSAAGAALDPSRGGLRWQPSYLGGRVVVTTGDITSIAVDAIVNAANSAADGRRRRRWCDSQSRRVRRYDGLRRASAHALSRRVAGGRGGADDGGTICPRASWSIRSARSGAPTSRRRSCLHRATGARSS